MSESLQRALDDLVADRDLSAAHVVALEAAIDTLQRIIDGEGRAPPSRPGPARPSKPAKPRAAGDGKTCSEPGCGAALRSDNARGMCSRHANVIGNRNRRAAKGAKPRAPKASSNGHGDTSPAAIGRWRKETLAPVLATKKGSQERGDAIRQLAIEQLEVPGREARKYSEAAIGLWLRQLEG